MNTQATNQTKVRLLDLAPDQFLAVCYTSKKLTKEISIAIYDSFNDFFSEMISPYLIGVGNYNIGLYNQNYIKVTEPDEFFVAVGDHIKALATSEEVTKLYNKCQKLKDEGNNLFGYTVEKELKDAVLDEANQIAKYYEDMDYQVYWKATDDEQLNKWVDIEIIGCERYPFNTLVIDLTTGEVRDERPETTVPADQLEAIRKAMTD